MGETTNHGSALRIMMSVDCAEKEGIGQNAHPPTKRSPSEKQYQRKLYQKKRSYYQGQRSHNQDHKNVDAVEYETDGETYEPTFYSITVSNKCLDSAMTHR